MIFLKHSEISGQHAFLGASQYHWINYSEDKLIDTYQNHIAKLKGTQLHEFAMMCIQLNQRLPDLPKTLNMYVNDAIGYKMQTEQPLYYSENCFGTADAICFRNGKLIIHDLKTGHVPAHMEQLLVYTALFCLEYNYKPHEIEIELRIYQNDSVLEYFPTAEDIVPIMDKIIAFDKIIKKIRREENGL